MNQIKIDPERTSGDIDRDIFGKFAEHLACRNLSVVIGESLTKKGY